jgi:hypothetical protein
MNQSTGTCLDFISPQTHSSLYSQRRTLKRIQRRKRTGRRVRETKVNQKRWFYLRRPRD